ncbi:MAG: peptide chain release factor N(5)-glutamine methyltransferase [Nevskiales bacterium]
MSETIRSALQHGVASLSKLTTDPHVEATALLSHCLGQPRSYLFAHDDEELPRKVARQYMKLVKRRTKGEPYAYVAGVREFWSIELAVNHHVLIPRPDTEILVEAALKHIPEGLPCRVADLGTGSGAVAIAIASERPQAFITATDISAKALDVAKVNVERHAKHRIECRKGDWADCLGSDRYDIIVSNPPYVAVRDPHLEDLPYEPQKALVAGPDGLDELRRLIPESKDCLRQGGWLLVEHGSDQGQEVRELFIQSGYQNVSTRLDLGGNERVTLGQAR